MTRDGNTKRQVRRQARSTGIPYTQALADRRLLDAQLEFYDQHAPDYGTTQMPDRLGDLQRKPVFPADRIDEPLRRLEPRGDILELACGPGPFTAPLADAATTLTALDSSAAMLRRNQADLGTREVRYVEADIFTWEPTATYDFVFFGFWLAHVPPRLLEPFWGLVRSCLRPGGRVGFVDEDERAMSYDVRQQAHDTPVARRKLADGRTYDIVKVFWSAPALERRLDDLGWDIQVRQYANTCLTGVGQVRTG